MPKLFKPNSTHMLYKVTDPSRRKVSYIFGSLTKVSPQVQQEIVDKILATGVLDHCDKFVLETLPPTTQATYQFNPHSVADGLMGLAMNKGLDPVPLDTRSYALKQAVKAEVRDLLRPLPVIKWSFLLATFPGPLALYLLGRHVQRQHQHKKLLEHYREESIDRELEKLSGRPGTYEEVIVKRNAKWLTEGYDGDLDYTTLNTGLGDYLSNHRTFVAIGASNLHGPNGIKHLLENQGFQFEEVPWLEHANNVGPIHTAAHP